MYKCLKRQIPEENLLPPVGFEPATPTIPSHLASKGETTLTTKPSASLKKKVISKWSSMVHTIETQNQRSMNPTGESKLSEQAFKL